MTLVLYSAAENTYCVIKVEGESLRSETVVGSASPTFHLEGVFFRYDVCKAIEIQVSHWWDCSEWYLRFNWNNVYVLLSSCGRVVGCVTTFWVARWWLRGRRTTRWCPSSPLSWGGD
jgi:hypothetical protein